MKRLFSLVVMLTSILTAETLFEVKDASNNKVLDVSTDGLRIMNAGDTLMVISSSEIKANLSNTKGLSRSFSVSTTTSKGTGNDLMRLTGDSTRFWISDEGSGFGVSSQTAAKGKSIATNFLKISNVNTQMREGASGDRYTDFSPENIFIGLNSGINSYFSLGYGGQELGVNNVFLGNNSGKLNTEGFGNIFIGNMAGYNNDTGFSNMFIGNNSGEANTEGYANLFIGDNSGVANSTGDRNTFVGYHSGLQNISGSANTVFGNGAGYGNESGSHNSVFGYESGQYNDTGSYNSYFGSGSGESNTAGSNNSVFGYEAGNGDISYTFNNNSFFGSKSGFSIRTGSNNTFLGYQSGYSNVTGSGNLFLGYMAGYSETLSNKLYIANSNTTTPLIEGTFPNTDLIFTSSMVSVVHPLGETTNGFSIKTSYNLNTDSWHFYQQTDDELGLYYNTGLRGSFNITTGAYTSVSDRKLKKNIENLNNLSARVMKLQPVRYNFINQKDDEKKYLGLIAQDVEKLFPEFVNYNEESDTYTMDYAGLSVVAIQAIKEQQAEIYEMKKQIEELRELIQK